MKLFRCYRICSKFFSTLHEQCVGGINGKLAELIEKRDYDSVISLFERSQPTLRTTASLNYAIEAYFCLGQHFEGLMMVKNMENLKLKPSIHTFNCLLKGLVAADSVGTLALTVDEIFQLMRYKYEIVPDWQTWMFRIQAFLHSKYFNFNDRPASRLIYEEIIRSDLIEKAKKFELQIEILLTAASRRIWSFAEYVLEDLKQQGELENFFLSYWERLSLAKNIFSEIGCVPVLRELQRFSLRQSQDHLVASPILSLNFHKNILVFSSRQGTCCADLAAHSLSFLLKHDVKNRATFLSVALRVLSRIAPLDSDFYIKTENYNVEKNGALARMLIASEKLKCSDEHVKQLHNLLSSFQISINGCQ